MQSLMGRNGRRRGMLPNGLGLLAVLGLLTTQAALVHAQTGSTQTGNAQTSAWPLKPLRIVAPFPPGGPADVQGRAIGQKLSQQLGQPVIIDNRPGAAGNIGADMVAKAAPDGHTILLLVNSYTINTSLYRNLSWDLQRDFAPIGRYATSPLVLVVNDKMPVQKCSLWAFSMTLRLRPPTTVSPSTTMGSPNIWTVSNHAWAPSS